MTAIRATNLSKRYGGTVAVDDLSFDVEPGRVTGFLGPNGAGKSTTMRMILGLDHPSGGSVLVDGKPYAELKHPSARSARCWTPRPCTAGAARATTCWPSPRATASPRAASTRSWRSSG
ncbi:hypothetical protein GCM10020001_051040 [Nonomuraea salmonea]